jgi:hypothetical protein
LWNAIWPTCLILGISNINIIFLLRSKIQGKPSTSFQHVCYIRMLCYDVLNLSNIEKYQVRRKEKLDKVLEIICCFICTNFFDLQ